ncbi:MAG: BrnA antitoxin family protein [Oscillospiraceae bacterium]|nr:BrnA antitoxin family protein [Oscillospiraceae bacterium]
MDRPLKQKVSITLDGDIVENIKIYAEKNDRSFSQYINMVLKGHIKRVENSNSKKLKT